MDNNLDVLLYAFDILMVAIHGMEIEMVKTEN